MRNNQQNFFLDAPSTDFEKVRDGRGSMPLWIDIDLTTARSIAGTGANAALVINIAGNSFYVDQDTTNVGFATVHFQDTNLGASSAPLFVSPGFIASVPFTQILIENAAQGGKRLRIFYGVDIDFQAGVNASIAISGNVSVVEPVYTGNFASTTVLAANAPQTILAPAANTNGAIVNLASIASFTGVLGYVALIAKASAPANVLDGDVLLINSPPTTIYYGIANQISSKIRVPAGKGLYFISSALETTGARCCTYTLL